MLTPDLDKIPQELKARPQSGVTGSAPPHGGAAMDHIATYQKHHISFFPLRKKSKKPLFDWAVYQTRKPTQAEVKEWLEKGLLNQVAIVCGEVSGIIVLDVDDPEKFEAWKTKNGFPLPPTPMVRTSGGKYHVYFKHPGGKIKNMIKKIPGADIKADGGYVVAPPSVHPTGSHYEWIEALSVYELADPPTWLTEFFKADTIELSKDDLLGPDDNTGVERDNAQLSQYAQAALSGELAKLAGTHEGNRNAQLNQSAFALGQLVAAKVIDRGTVEAALEGEAASIGLTSAEVRATICSGIEAGMKEPRKLPEKTAKSNSGGGMKGLLQRLDIIAVHGKETGLKLLTDPPRVTKDGFSPCTVLYNPDDPTHTAFLNIGQGEKRGYYVEFKNGQAWIVCDLYKTIADQGSGPYMLPKDVYAHLSKIYLPTKTGATGDSWPEPDPLRRKPEPGEPYPVEALGKTLGEAAMAMHSIIKAPLAICSQSALAAANLAVQGHADVVIDGRRFPVSEYFLSIAQSGERKSAADNAALTPVDGHQRYLLDAYTRESAQYALEAALWKKEFDEALRKGNSQTRRAALESLPPAPTGPPYPQLTTEEPTYEGLVKLLALGWPTVGLFSSEGGRFFGGYAMNLENRLKTLAGLSDLWDGHPLTRTRAGDGSVTLYGRRCCAHLLMQPLVAETILSDPLAHDQGFLSRCLIIAPESALGSQTYVPQDLNQQAAYGRYCARITAILQAKLPFKPDPETGKPTNELTTRPLQIATDAKADWIDFHDWVQSHLHPDGIYRPISGIAAKAAEHALRLAGTLTLMENLDATIISQEKVRGGIVLANFYLGEALRLHHSAKTDTDLINAEKVLAWLRTREGVGKHLICLPDVYRLGPNAVRDKATAAKIMAILADHGWLKQVEGGTEIDGKKRRQVWMVSPHAFEAAKI